MKDFIFHLLLPLTQSVFVCAFGMGSNQLLYKSNKVKINYPETHGNKINLN